LARSAIKAILWFGLIGAIGIGLAVVPAKAVSAIPLHTHDLSSPAWAPWGHGTALGVNPDFNHPVPAQRQVPHIPGARATTMISGNWSGVVDTSATFTGVASYWTVPAVQASQSSAVSSTWIGVDGSSNTDLIQAGTEQDTSGGSTNYFAWYEILPAPEVEIGAVSPGDEMKATIEEASPGTWTISIADLTSSQSASGAVSYSGPGTSAEWIEEMPTVTPGPQPPLANFGTAHFSTLGFFSPDPAVAVSNPVVMENASNDVEAYPSSFANDDLTITYGPFATQTSVTAIPNPVTSGTLVTYSASVTSPYGGTPIGSVTISTGATILCTATLSNGSGSCSSSLAPIGADTISGTYPGDNIYATSTGTTMVTVNSPAPPPPSPPPPTPQHGYWLVGSDGGIFSFGSAQFYGSTGNIRLQRPVVGIVPTSDHGGYWLDASDGGVFSFGDTQFYGSIPGVGLHPAGSGLPNSLNAPIVGMVPSSDGGGYFMVASDGGVFAFGDAHFAGSCPGIGGCSGAAVAVMPDRSGSGYWVVTSTGNVYGFGDAPNLGAPGHGTVTSAAGSPNGTGYWVLLSNGEVFSYGAATPMGSPSSANFNALDSASSIFVTADGGGYWVSSSQGAVYNFGDAPNDGDMAGTHLNGSIIAATGF
jgi:hypothetical protein